MNSKNENKSIKDKVLAQLKSDGVKMRPKWHFVSKAVLILSGGIIAALTLLYLSSFIVFILRQNGVWFTPAFGFRGLGIFLTSLPWLLVFTALIFIIMLEFFVKRYSFSYRKPILYSVLGIVIFIFVGSFIISQTRVHQDLFMRAQERKLPFAGSLYRDYGMQRFENVHSGNITNFTENKIHIINRRGEELVIILTPKTRFPYGTEFSEGDRIIVIGEREDNSIKALGVLKVTDEIDSDRRRHYDSGRIFSPFRSR